MQIFAVNIWSHYSGGGGDEDLGTLLLTFRMQQTLNSDSGSSPCLLT